MTRLIVLSVLSFSFFISGSLYSYSDTLRMEVNDPWGSEFLLDAELSPMLGAWTLPRRALFVEDEHITGLEINRIGEIIFQTSIGELKANVIAFENGNLKLYCQKSEQVLTVEVKYLQMDEMVLSFKTTDGEKRSFYFLR